MGKKRIADLLKTLDNQEIYSLHLAALMGRTFFLDHVLEISDIRASKFLRLLDRLIDQGLVREQAGNFREKYYFKNKTELAAILKPLTREEKKKYLHNIVSYLEKDLQKNEDRAPLLADIYLKLRTEENDLRFLKRAADLLSNAHRTIEALALYKDVIDQLLKKDRDSTENSLLLSCVIAYAPIAINRCSAEEILPVLRESISISRHTGNSRSNSLLEICMGRLLQSIGKGDEAYIHYQEGWRFAEELGDKDLLRDVSKNYALSLFWQGKISEAISIYERTLGNLEEISTELRDLWAYLMLAYCYGIKGQVSRGVGLAEAVRERALSRGYLRSQSFAHAVIAHILLEARKISDAKPHIEKALEIGDKTGSSLALWMAKPCKAYELYSRGDLHRAKEFLESAISHAKSLGQVYSPSPLIIEILWALHTSEHEPIKDHSFFSEVERLMSWSNIYMQGASLRYLALAKKREGRSRKEIEGLLRESRSLLAEAGAEVELSRTEIELCRLYLESDNLPAAKESCKLAYRKMCKVDDHLFPSELLFLVHKKKKEQPLFDGISKLGVLSQNWADQNDFLGKVIGVLTDMFAAERGVILLTKEKAPRCSFKVAAARNFSPEELNQFKKGPLYDLLQKSMKENQILITSPGKDIIKPPVDSMHNSSIACVPMKIGDSINGVIYMDNRLIKGLFSRKDILAMTAIGNIVGMAIENSHLHRQIRGLQDRLKTDPEYSEQFELAQLSNHIIGNSAVIRKVMKLVRKVASSDATVFISGETGVGKELIARSIHLLSQRADKPFVTVNISALSEGLIESELFGHEKGAFTGAVRDKPGRFEMANKGTIFLDEIGDLSVEAQVKLLRVLQEGEFERVGGTRTLRSDFRLIVATNRDLRMEISKGKFRIDLFYRLDIFPITIPSLKDRPKDIPLLATYFTKNYAMQHRKNIRIPDHEMRKLIAYTWPGNIRELKHVIERSVILSENGDLRIPDLTNHQIPPEPENAQGEVLLSLDEIQRTHILSVLGHVKWRIRGEKGASKILGLKASTLEARMKKLGIMRR